MRDNNESVNESGVESQKLQEDHLALVSELTKPGREIAVSLTPQKCDVWHAVTGISGEAGEILDAVKKWVIYEKPLDLTNIIEELGDIEFYLAQLRSALEIDRSLVLQSNIVKLRIRYGKKYSNKGAIERADKKEEPDHDHTDAAEN